MFPYIVWAPPFDRRSGGCKVLHALAHELDKKVVLLFQKKQKGYYPKIDIETGFYRTIQSLTESFSGNS